MTIEEKITTSIQAQFADNSRKNFFYNESDRIRHFSELTRNIIENNREELISIDIAGKSNQFVDFFTQQAVKVFCNANQYIDLRKADITDLHTIYKTLWNEIIRQLKNATIDFEALEKLHIARIRQWLLRTNPFLCEMNNSNSPKIINVVCEEYSSELQLELLGINLENLMEPIIDIGCGASATLVNYLRSLGIEAYGIDRLVSPQHSFLYPVNWFEFEFVPNCWGTIISNLSFTIHFINHHHRKDSNYEEYARKYMEIINSLKVQGTYFYAPSLPMIESYLPTDKFQVDNWKINESISTTRLMKIA